ncbi:MAG: FAD binding domain-containing protein [Anaerolineales bacterium]
MTIPCEEYILSHSIEQALRTLSGANGMARIVAGGSDLLLDLQAGRHPPVRVLVDVTEINEMRALEIRQESLFIGAAVTLSNLRLWECSPPGCSNPAKGNH